MKFNAGDKVRLTQDISGLSKWYKKGNIGTVLVVIDKLRIISEYDYYVEFEHFPINVFEEEIQLVEE